jgi:hypothetical protein
MNKLLVELRASGLESEKMLEIEQVMREVEFEAAAIAPEPPRSAIQAALAQLWVRVLEIRSRQLKQYGPVDNQTGTFLDAQSKRLDELVTQLIDEYERTKDAV